MIHPTAIIDPNADLAEGVRVGPYSVIGAGVQIGRNCEIGPHAVVKGETIIGENNRIFQFSSIGEDCQDKKYNGEPTRLVIGDNNIFREFVSIHRGTIQDDSVTTIGSGCLFMNYSHIAHDCVIDDNVIIANACQIAGHVRVGKGAIIGGSSGIHQFCRVGDFAMVGGGTLLFKDVPAFVTVQGNPTAAHGMNYEGMKRRGYSKELINQLRNAYKVIYRQSNTLKDALAELRTWEDSTGEIARLIRSIEQSTKGIVR